MKTKIALITALIALGLMGLSGCKKNTSSSDPDSNFLPRIGM